MQHNIIQKQNIDLPVTVKCAQEFALVIFNSCSAFTNSVLQYNYCISHFITIRYKTFTAHTCMYAFIIRY